MSIRSILVPAAPGLDIRPRLDVALRIGGPTAAHIRVVFFVPDPSQVLASLSGLAIAVDATLSKLELDAATAFAATKASFEAWCTKNAVRILSEGDPGNGDTSARLLKRSGDLEIMLAAEAGLNDLTMLERPDDPNPFQSRAFDASVFRGGRLSMIVPPHMTDETPLDHILIAWNGSLEATRALAQALPLLRAGQRVSIFSGPRGDGEAQPAADLARYLHWHGVAAGPLYDPSLGTWAGERILALAKNEGVSAILMGAYTHSRARQYFLGGVTQHLLNHSHVPLLMAH